MKAKIFLILLFFATIYAFAQNTISGTVKNSEGETVPSASVTVEEPGNDAIIAYGITNIKGEYKVTFSTSQSNVDVKIKAFNHKPQTRQIANRTQNLDFTIDTEATEIQEVKLKTKLITKKGDTITYDLKSFETKNDRVLADVLKRMPGIEVNKDGSILYQGQPLSKFYVNGKDLMEGGYGVINNSLPKDAIQKVEVLENHQPVKILQDKVPSDQAAINIKLKNKVTLTGRGEAGSGFLDPWLWNLKLTPMFFGQKNQWVVNYKTNNVGETVEQEANLFAMGNRWEGRRSNASQNIWLGVEMAATPNLPEKRYLMNNVHFLSANILTNPFENKEWELKAAATYINNTIERESYKETYDKVSKMWRSLNIFNRLYTNRAKGEVTFTKNAKKGFFKNMTTFNQFWNANRADVERPVPFNQFAAQGIDAPSTSFQNSLSTIIPLKTKMLNVMSYISYQDDRQSMDVTPGDYIFYPFSPFQNAGLVNQNLRNKTFEANHSATIGFTKKYWTFTPEVGFNYYTADLETNVTGQLPSGNIDYGNTFSNDLKYSRAVPYAGLGINYKSENWTLAVQTPVNFNIIKAKDPVRNVDKDFTRTTFEPSGFIQYAFASFWKAMVMGNVGNTFGGIDDTYAGYIVTSPSTLQAMRYDNPILETFSKRIGSRIEYRNPLNNLFFNVNYNYNDSKRNLLPSLTVNPAGFASTSYILRDNKVRSHTQFVDIGKYFPKFKSNLSFSFRNTNAEAENFRNEELFLNKNSSRSLGGKFNNAYFSWLTFDYNFSMGWSKNESRFFSSENRNFTHNMMATIFPAENHSIALNWDQLNYSETGENFKNAFFDLTYQYAWAKRKIDFELKWLNIANKKVFEGITDTASEYTFEKIQIRPSQVMFTVKFNFK